MNEGGKSGQKELVQREEEKEIRNVKQKRENPQNGRLAKSKQSFSTFIYACQNCLSL